MKNLFLILTVTMLVFQSCSSDDDTNDDPVIEVCDTPISLSVSEITFNTAVLNWNNPNTNLEVKVEYGLTGFTPGTGTVVMISQNSLTIDELTANNTYDFYVQALCATNNTSTVSEIVSFTTDIHPLAGTWSGTYSGDFSGTSSSIISDEGIVVSNTSTDSSGSTTSQVSSVLNSDWSFSYIMDNGSSGTGQYTSETEYSGTWVNGPYSGTFTGTKD